MYYTFQDKNFETLKENLNSNFLLIRGKKNSGRCYTVYQLENLNYSVIEIKPEQNDLASIKNAFIAKENFLKSQFEIEANASINYKCFALSLKFNKKSLCAQEKFLINLLKKHCKTGKVVLLIKSYPEIDSRSKLFIGNLCAKISEYRGNLHIVIINKPTNNELPSTNFKTLDFLDVCYNFEIFKQDVNGRLKKPLNNDELSFIYSNINGDMVKLSKIIDSLNNYGGDFNTPSSELYNEVVALIENDIDKESVLKSLKFISIIEEDVKDNDLAFLLNTKNNVISEELQSVINKKLLEFNNSKYDFTLKILKNIFSDKSQNEIISLYNKVVELYEELYPSKYERMYYYAKKANSTSYKQYYVQNILKQIRCNPSYDLNFNEIQKVISDHNIVNFIKDYNNAVNEAAIDNYDNADNILKSLVVTSYLRYEADLLRSQCLIKSLDENKRELALSLLETSSKKLDKNLDYRYSVRRISAYVHAGKYSQAISEFTKLEDKLQNDYDANGSDEVLGYINVLNRRCNNVYSCDLARVRMKKAVDTYKDKSNCKIEYYIALCNYFGINILNYDLINAELAKDDINKLQKAYSRLNFPRKYIFENDYLLYQYFKNETDSVTAEAKFKDLLQNRISYEHQDFKADSLFIQSNYSIFLAINGKIKEAINILEKEKKKFNIDNEGIYDFRLTVNLAIYKFIDNNENRDKCLDDLNNIRINSNTPDSQWQKLKLKKIKNIIKEKSVSDMNEWINEMENGLYESESPDPLKYYGKAFVYTTVFNWDDD